MATAVPALEGAQLNYRHAFHAGNFADLVKHAALLQALARLTAGPEPLTVIDTHAGAGMYDLTGEAAQRSREAEAGVQALMAAAGLPPEMQALRVAVEAANQGGVMRLYPGSPWLIAQALRAQDQMIACELRAQEHAPLSRLLAGRRGVRALCADGYDVAVERCPARGKALVLIDPPFERADDYRRCAETARRLRARNGGAVLLIWTPLKDLETFDGFLRSLEGDVTALEVRLRPLTDPMRLNGCGLVVVADDFAKPLLAIGDWVARSLGEAGSARIL
jgi:23S rRNA (adenine2030-N6)-methyltransferase